MRKVAIFQPTFTETLISIHFQRLLGQNMHVAILILSSLNEEGSFQIYYGGT